VHHKAWSSLVTRWRQSFMAEVTQSLQQFGVKACPVCGSQDGLAIGRRPVLIVDGEFPPPVGGVPMEADRDRFLTFAVQIECTTCGHLMLFNAERYRTGKEPIMLVGAVDEDGRPIED
jgi:hypothetical protein